MAEGPYELPKGWRWVKLGEVVDHQRRSIDPRRFPDELFLLYSIPSYDRGKTPERVHGKQIGSNKLLIKGDVCLFSKLNPRIPRAWVVHGTSSHRRVASTEFMQLKPKEGTLDLNYLGKILISKIFLDQVRIDITGATGSRQRLKPNVILNARIPLPPLPEQRRIVARIEELMERVREARRLREEAKKDVDRLMQAALAEVFPRPGDSLPPSWRWMTLGEVARREVKTIKPSDMPDRVFNYLGMEHVAPNQWEEPKPEPRLGVEIRSSVIMFWPGLVLYGKLRPYLNKVVVPSTEGVASTEFVPIRPDEKTLLPSFLGAFLRSPSFVSYAISNTTGSRQPRIRMDALWNALIPLPPIPEQRRIVAYLDQIQARVTALKKAQESTEAELHGLEQAILDKAFRGELSL